LLRKVDSGKRAPPIQRDGDVYTFTGNIQGSIVIERSNVVIDGNAQELQGAGSEDGFSLSSICNVTIRNTEIAGFGIGIAFRGSVSNSGV
jgi:hypothetical protein